MGGPSVEIVTERGPRLRWNRPLSLVVAMTLNNIAVLGYHLIVSRALGPSGYGAAGAVLALTGVLQAVQTAGLAVVAKAAAARPNVRAWDIRVLERRFVLLAACVAAVGLAGAPVLERYLHLSSPLPVVAMAALAAAVLVSIVPKGVLLGQRNFGALSSAVLAGALGRIVLAPVLTPAFGVSGAVGVAAAAEVLTSLIVMRRSRSGHLRAAAPVLRLHDGMAALSIAASTGLWLLTSADVFLARHLIGGRGSGLYVAASIAASAALFLPYNVTWAAFPSLVAEMGVEARAFLRYLALIVAATTAIAAVLVFLRAPIIAIGFGSAYEQARPLLALLAVSNAAQGIVGFLQLHQLAHHQQIALVPWLALIALAAVAYSAHSRPRQIASEAVVVSVVCLVVMTSASLRLARAHR